jgi:hypothetical protein
MSTAVTARPDRFVFTLLFGAALVVGIAGFAPTYFLKYWFDTPPLTLRVHIHALLFTAWLCLLLYQSVLIRTRQYATHARLGKAALLIVALMVITGIMVVLQKPRPTEASRAFIFTPLLSLVLFPLFVAAAIRFRRDAATHKRLMWLATLLFMGAPLTRLLLMAGVKLTPYLNHLAMYLLLLVPLVVYDLWRFRRLHPATLWGGAVLLIRHPIHEIVAYTPAWQHLAASITPDAGGT